MEKPSKEPATTSHTRYQKIKSTQEHKDKNWQKQFLGEEVTWASGKNATHGQGPGYYGEWNTSRLAAELEAERRRGIGDGFAVARPGLPEDDAELRRAAGVHRPHYWSSRLYGEPHGEWESPVLEPGAPAGPEDQHPEHPHPLVAADPNVVYQRHGGKWSCNSCWVTKPAGQMHHCRRCWTDRQKQFDLCDGCWVRLRVDRRAGCTVGRLEELEWEIRDAVDQLRSHRHDLPRVVLTTLLAAADQGVILGGAGDGAGPWPSHTGTTFSREALHRDRPAVATATVAGYRAGPGSGAATGGGGGRGSKNGRIAVNNLRLLLRTCLGLPMLTKQEANGLLAKYGVDDDGLLPYEVFCHGLFAGAARQLAQRGFRRGPLDPLSPAGWADMRMLKYPQCRKAIMPPSSWDGTLAKRSSHPPACQIELSHVVGYAGRDAPTPNLFYTHDGLMLYYAAAVAIVYDPDANTGKGLQRFFTAHSGSISCLAIDPARRLAATGQVGVAHTATKVTFQQVAGATLTVPETRISSAPKILIWDVDTFEIVQTLTLSDGDISVAALGFSHEGDKLAAVTADDDHSMRVWDWRTGVELVKEKVVQGGEQDNLPRPKVYGLVWNRYKGAPTAALVDIVTFGVDHLAVWALEPTDTLPWDVTVLNLSPWTNVSSALFLETGQLLTAGADGNVAVWADGGEEGWLQMQYASFAQLHQGMPVTAIKESLSPSEVEVGPTAVQLITGGGDGSVRFWVVEPEAPAAELELEDKDSPPAPPGLIIRPDPGQDVHRPAAASEPTAADGGVESRRMIVSVDTHEARSAVVAGDDHDDIWLLDAADPDPGPRLAGMGGDVTGMAAHPTRPGLYAACSAAGHILIGDLANNRVLQRCILVRQRDAVLKRLEKGERLRPWTCTFSPTGRMLAVSTSGVVGDLDGQSPDQGGGFMVFRFDADRLIDAADEAAADDDGVAAPSELPLLWEAHEQDHLLTVLKFSPDETLLAAAGHQRVVDVFKVGAGGDGEGWRRVAQCHGHSGTILHLDWAADSSMFQTSSADYDLLCWDRRGRQLMTNQRDKDWATQNVPLGWNVMGIWAAGMPDGQTITAVDRSPCGRFVLAADDLRQLRLLNYPAVVKHAPSLSRTGHGHAVTSACWAADGSHVVSGGGADRAVFQWAAMLPALASPPATIIGGGRSAARREAAEAVDQNRDLEQQRKTCWMILQRQKRTLQAQEVEIEQLRQQLGKLPPAS